MSRADLVGVSQAAAGVRRAGRSTAEPGVSGAALYISGDEYVVTDELGIPLHPESYSDEFTRMLKRAGHYDSSFTMKTYVHASDDDLKQGRQALAKIHHII